MPTVKEISVDSLATDPYQSRDRAWEGDEDDLQLTSSIEEEGLMQDLVVRPANGHGGEDIDYTIIAGSRRFEAAIRAGKDEVRCKVVEADDPEAAFKSIQENEARKELSEQELSEAVWRLRVLITEDQISCPDCGEEFDSQDSLVGHMRAYDCQYETEGNESSPHHPPFTNHTDAIRYISNRLYGDDTGERRVARLIDNHQLPEELQSLLKDPEQRTAQEQMQLENFGIDPEVQYSAESGNSKSKFSTELTRMYNDFSESLDTDQIDPSRKVLETVGRIDVGEEMSKTQVRRELQDFRRDITEQLDRSESAAEQRGVIDAELEEREQRLREKHVTMERNVPFSALKFELDDQRHARYHEIAKQERGFDAHSETVRELYAEYLEELAEENGW